MSLLHRRRLIASAAAIAASPATHALAQSAPSAATRLNALLDDFMQRNLRRSPETATSLGLDVGALGGEKFRLDDRSLAQAARDKAENFKRQTELAAIDRAALTGSTLSTTTRSPMCRTSRPRPIGGSTTAGRAPARPTSSAS
jgi:uncharacterized protein (DUF885 family)